MCSVPTSNNNAVLFYLLLMPPLISTDIVHALPRPNQRILTRGNALNTTKIRRRTERNLLLLCHVVISHLVDDQFAYRHPSRAFVRHCCIVKYVVIIGDVCLNAENNRLLRKALVEVFFKIALVELPELCWIIGIQVITVSGVKAVTDVINLALCAGKDVCVGLVISDVAVCQRIGLG